MTGKPHKVEPPKPALDALTREVLGLPNATYADALARLTPAEIEIYIRDLSGIDSADLQGLAIPPTRWAVTGLLPAGLGVLASPPKTGKSLLCYQLAVGIAKGSDVLDRATERRHVRYYALEDGPGRSQDRVARLGWPQRGWLDIRWESPSLGEGLEDDVTAFLDKYPDGVVIIDVLAKVRPAGGRGNAYDEDYTVLKAMKAVTRHHPAAVVLLVTHDRKAGSEDWMTRITGTRGVSGSADFNLFIDRKRGEPIAKIAMAGRDLTDDVLAVKLVDTHWEVAILADVMASPTISETRQRIIDWVEANGPAWQKAIADGTGLGKDIVDHRVRDMAKDGQLVGSPAGYVVGDANA